MRLTIVHETSYLYAGAVFESHNEARLRPLDDDDQLCLEFELVTEPRASVFEYAQVGGIVHHFNLRAAHDTLKVTARALVETRLANPFAAMNLVGDDWERLDALRHGANVDWLLPTSRVPDTLSVRAEAWRLAEVARKDASSASVASFLLALSGAIRREYAYDPGATDVESTLEAVIAHRAGVCQDYAHLMLAVCRHEGIAARYVSGYLRTDGGFRTGDVMHAWIECLLPGLDHSPIWRGFDPTNDMVTGDGYVKAHVGRDYDDIAPLRGVYLGPPGQTLTVSVRVTDEVRLQVTGDRLQGEASVPIPSCNL